MASAAPNAFAPAVDASNVKVPEVLPIATAASNVTVLVTVLLFARFNRAPAPEPLPLTLSGSATDSPEPSKWIAAPLFTVVPAEVAPNAASFAMLSTPAATVVAPV